MLWIWDIMRVSHLLPCNMTLPSQCYLGYYFGWTLIRTLCSLPQDLNNVLLSCRHLWEGILRIFRTRCWRIGPSPFMTEDHSRFTQRLPRQSEYSVTKLVSNLKLSLHYSREVSSHCKGTCQAWLERNFLGFELAWCHCGERPQNNLSERG